jgi:DUF4097 and DUF4098 domain-containing protein YvlB
MRLTGHSSRDRLLCPKAPALRRVDRAVCPGLAIAVILAAGVSLHAQAPCQPVKEKEADTWSCTYHEEYHAVPRVRVIGHGPVKLHGGTAQNFVIEAKISVNARNKEIARRMLEKLFVMREERNGILVVNTPGGPAESTITMLAPRLEEAYIHTSDGAVEAEDIDGSLAVETGADLVKVNRIRGNCRVENGGGDVEVGRVDGWFNGRTLAGALRAEWIGGEVYFKTNAGDIEVKKIGSGAHFETGGGTVHVGSAGGPVTAVNRGGPIIVDQSSGIVTASSVAGLVRIGAAAGIQCQSAGGGIQLNRITGPITVATEMGNIFANLVGSRLMSSMLATARGDITVVVPSNVGVTIRAQNQMADSLRRINSDYRELQPRPVGTWLVAEGRLNGGGPLLQISASSGTIFIKRQ